MLFVHQLGVKKQKLSRFDEEIADRIDDRLSYRKGWPRLPALPQWTCYKFDPLAYFPNFDCHRENINKILRVQGLHGTQIQIVHRLHYEQYQADTTTATLFMTAAPDDGLTYKDAVLDIRKYLIANDINVAIELMDRRALKMHTFPLLASLDGAIISGREGVMFDRVRDVLKQSKLRWVAVNIVRRGMDPDQSECRPTLLVSALDASEDKRWDNVRPLLQLFRRDYLEVEIRQCIRFGDAWREVEDDWINRVATNDQVAHEVAF